MNVMIVAPSSLTTCPAIMRIRGTLLVSGSIGHLDKPEAVTFIEAARLPVRLKGPEVQLLRIFPDSCQKGQPDSAAMPCRVDIEMLEPIRLRDRKSDQPALILGQPDCGGWEDVALEKSQILLRRVELGQIRKAGSAHVAVQPGHSLHVVRGSMPQNEAGHYSAQTRVGGKITSTSVPSLG